MSDLVAFIREFMDEQSRMHKLLVSAKQNTIDINRMVADINFEIDKVENEINKRRTEDGK